MREKVLVTDGRSLATLAIARSLGSKGIEVHVGEEFRYNITSFSKHVETNHVYPSPEDQPEEFIEWLTKTLQREAYDSIIPVRDVTTALVAKNEEVLAQHTGLCVTDYGTIRRLMDKATSMKLAAEHGIPIPRTYYPAENGFERIHDEATAPLLIKPRDESGARGIVRVEHLDDLESRYRAVDREHPNPIVQEYVDHAGGHYSIGTLFNRDSEPVATHVYKETKQYPLSGGPAVNAVSVEKEPWVDDLLRLLREVEWQGPAHMDVLYDPHDDTYKLLEVNPRFWMSLNLSVQSGVDVPALLFELTKGETPTPVSTYDVGTEYRWVFPNEILWVLAQNGKTNAVKEVLRRPKNETCYGVISREDPRPLAGVAAQSLRFLTDPEKRAAIFGRGW